MNQKECLNTNCGARTLYARGICRRCYNSHAARVSAGRVTWKELEQAGLVTRRVKRRKKPDPGRPQCIAEGCEQACRVRGLCSTHYCRAKNRINKGQTTWEELEAAGLSKPPTKRVRAEIVTRPKPEKESDGDCTQSFDHAGWKDWEREFYREWDKYLATKRGTTKAVAALMEATAKK